MPVAVVDVWSIDEMEELSRQALLVVEESKTRVTDIQAATADLHEDIALGLVLNKAVRSHKDTYGYYGYGHIVN